MDLGVKVWENNIEEPNIVCLFIPCDILEKTGKDEIEFIDPQSSLTRVGRSCQDAG